MVTMMEHNIAYEAKLNQDPPGGGGANPPGSQGTPTTPSRRARLQMAKSPRLLHHQRSVGHYGDNAAGSMPDPIGLDNRTSSETVTPSPSVTPSVNTPMPKCQSSSSPNKINLNKLRTEAFLKPISGGSPATQPTTPTSTHAPSASSNPAGETVMETPTVTEPSRNNKTKGPCEQNPSAPSSTPRDHATPQQPQQGSEGTAGGNNSTTPLRVGFYEIEGTIGRGNFAIVKLARHRITRTEVRKTRTYLLRVWAYSSG